MSQTAQFATPGFNYAELIDHYLCVEQPRHAGAKKLLAYWQDCMAKGDGFVVGRDIPARPIAEVLSNIVLYEPLPDGSDLKVRLAGASVRHRVVPDLKGSLLSQQFFGEDFKHHLASSFETIRSGVPTVLDSSLRRGSFEEMHSEVLLLPVTAPDLVSKWLLVGMFYFNS
jgi:hypothetical protein